MERRADLIIIDPSRTDKPVEHRYWSTHCRHDNHEACSATELTGVNVFSPEGHHSAIERKPAQCKTCGSPCICPCHESPVGSSEVTDGR